MFEAAPSRIFGLPPGVDFPARLVEGLRQRLAGQPPEAMARVTIWLNSEGMRQKVRAALASHGAGVFPALRLVTEVANHFPPPLPAAEPPLRRRLQLAQLVAGLLRAEPDLAPQTAVYDLADSLAELMDEMGGEGVSPATIAALDVSEHSQHWARTQRFLGIVAPFFGPSAAPDTEARNRIAVTEIAARWAARPPADPVIVAGSTGSRGATALLMQAVATLPNGALVLPGHDFEMPGHVWAGLSDDLTAEDHPQFRTRKLLDRLDIEAAQIAPWIDAPCAAPARNALVSLALRPAPVTDQWLAEGHRLPDLQEATANMALIEAPSPRMEAQSIALLLRKAAEDGRHAALVTPDRDLARQVSVALDRWGIVPDDSAGRPLGLTPPGRLLRQVAGLFGQRMTGDLLLALLKHPLVHTAGDRGEHLRHTRDLELHLRRHGPAFPDGKAIRAWAGAHDAVAWGDWLATLIDGLDQIPERPLPECLAQHRTMTETLAKGPLGDGPGTLWEEAAGVEALAAFSAIEAEAEHGGSFAPRDYAALVAAVLAGRQVRDTVTPHPLIRIRGTREAREISEGLVILGGLNDGTWPQLPPPDPWLNRQMRLRAGLLLPERGIGLSAHDFQQSIAAPEVVLTRATRTDEAECIPSRWLNRLLNLMAGLPARNGPQALAAMRARGGDWLALARALDQPEAAVARSPRPSPCPPVSDRPRELSVTRIEALIRDPYAIYAQYLLRLSPLSPLRAAPDVRLRGTILHKVMETHARAAPFADPARAHAELLAAAQAVMAAEVPWPSARALWTARIERVADWIITQTEALGGTPVLLEKSGSWQLPGIDFTLTARPDRVDRLPDGRIHIFDYKTGDPPTLRQMDYFSQQLALQAIMAANGAFETLGAAEVAGATYIGLGSGRKTTAVDLAKLPQVQDRLLALIGRFQVRDTGYTAQRAVFKLRFENDYDGISRFGEWGLSDPSVRIRVGAP